MAKMMVSNALPLLLFLYLLMSLRQGVYGIGIGINYGRIGDNLPQPSQVAEFLVKNTSIGAVKLYDADPSVLQAFAGTNIEVTVAIPNELVPDLAGLSFAQHWVRNNVLRYTPATKIVRILVGNEVISSAKKSLISSLVPAMQNLHTALVSVSLHDQIKVSSPHSLGILSTSSPPSTGKFRSGYDTAVIKPLLSFLRATGSPFMINAYPYFGFTDDTIDYALFRTTAGVLDPNTGMHYTNMFDAQLDAAFSAMKLLGFTDIDIVVAETGWPSKGDSWQKGISVENARDYTKHLVQHYGSGTGTPLMPNRTFETFIFALFNENLKPGPISERNFGLFRPDFNEVYDIGTLRSSSNNVQSVATGPTTPVSTNGRKWCVPKANTDLDSLQINIDFVCGQGVDCRPIVSGGDCFLPDTVESHAAFAMNKYFHVTGQNVFDCDFGQTGIITTADPSYGSCKYD